MCFPLESVFFEFESNSILFELSIALEDRVRFM